MVGEIPEIFFSLISSIYDRRDVNIAFHVGVCGVRKETGWPKSAIVKVRLDYCQVQEERHRQLSFGQIILMHASAMFTVF